MVPRWFHVDSFFEYADLDGQLTSIDDIDGADRLRCVSTTIRRAACGMMWSTMGQTREEKSRAVAVAFVCAQLLWRSVCVHRQHDQDLLTEEIAKFVASGGSGGSGKKRKAKVLSDDEDEDTDEDPIEVDDDWNGNDDDPIEDGGGRAHAWGAGSRLGGDDIEDLTTESPWPLKVGEVVRLKPGATDHEGGPLVPGNTVRAGTHSPRSSACLLCCLCARRAVLLAWLTACLRFCRARVLSRTCPTTLMTRSPIKSQARMARRGGMR